MQKDFVALVKRAATVEELQRCPLPGLVEITVVAIHRATRGEAIAALAEELPNFPAGHYGVIEQRFAAK